MSNLELITTCYRYQQWANRHLLAMPVVLSEAEGPLPIRRPEQSRRTSPYPSS